MAPNTWTAADLPDMSGRTVVVTGASSGLGVITARELARVGARVILAVRDVEKGRGAAATMTGDTEVRQLDLANLASVREFAAAWTGNLDVLVNNAGIMQVPEGRTPEGFELQIGTNHLGPFALTNLLLPYIRDRVVTVYSMLEARGDLKVADLNWKDRPYRSMQAYYDSKQANVLLTMELQRRLAESGSRVRAVGAHPGIARTNLTAHSVGVQATIAKHVGRLLEQSAEQGALPTLFAATMDIPGGSLIGPGGFAHLRGHPEIVRASAAPARDETARHLWDVSARLTNVDSPVRPPAQDEASTA